MPTKAQANAAVDSAGTAIKARINALPNGINIIDGTVNFNPATFVVKVDAGGSAATAATLASDIMTNYTAQGWSPTLSLDDTRRRREDGAKMIVIQASQITIYIVNF